MVRFKTLHLFIILVIPIFSGCFIHHKQTVIVPDENYTLDQKVLKSDGYYYRERTMTFYCKREIDGTGSRPVKESEYQLKGIIYLFLYTDGYLYNGGPSMLQGVSTNGEKYWDHCDLLERENSFTHARSRLEGWLEGGNVGIDKPIHKKGLFQRGTYYIEENSIKLQHYIGTEGGPDLIESNGEILNDTTFLITSTRYFNENIDYEDRLYKFKKFPIKPDSTNYIRDNKHKFGKK